MSSFLAHIHGSNVKTALTLLSFSATDMAVKPPNEWPPNINFWLSTCTLAPKFNFYYKKLG